MDGATYDPRLDTCPLCGGGTLAPFDRDFRGHRIELCRQCGVKLMNPQYSDEHLVGYYSDGVRFDHRTGDDLPMRFREEVHKEGKRRSLEMVSRYVDKGRLLSVGSADGVEIYTAQQNGWEAEGYEVSDRAVRELHERYGAVMHSGPFEDIAGRDGYYDAVFIDQVLEHVKNPATYLRKIHDLLRPGGILFLGLPNITSWTNRLKTLSGRLGLRQHKRGKHYATTHHLFYYSPGVAARALREHYGFDVLRVRGSLRRRKRRLSSKLGGVFPNAISGFFVIARRRAG